MLWGQSIVFISCTITIDVLLIVIFSPHLMALEMELCQKIHILIFRLGTTSNRYMSLVVRKPVFGVSDQVLHNPGCTAIEDD